jgi:hypothetical protein
METIIIGCKTLENELTRAIAQCGCPYEVKWVESGLHNVPKNLTSTLQAALDSTPKYSRALMAFGYCGNAVAGLRTGGKTVIFPRVDDCITLLLGSYGNRTAITKNGGTYFMTEGWLLGERNIWREYQYAIEKYGTETGESIISMMLEHHKSLALLDTGCFDMNSVGQKVKDIADILKLEYMVVPATIAYIMKLLTGPWDDESFLIIPPDRVIQDTDLTLK